LWKWLQSLIHLKQKQRLQQIRQGTNFEQCIPEQAQTNNWKYRKEVDKLKERPQMQM
jgi:hypothetical protein